MPKIQKNMATRPAEDPDDDPSPLQLLIWRKYDGLADFCADSSRQILEWMIPGTVGRLFGKAFYWAIFCLGTAISILAFLGRIGLWSHL